MLLLYRVHTGCPKKEYLFLKMNKKQTKRVNKKILTINECVMSGICFGTLHYVSIKSYRQVALRLLHLATVADN